MDTGILDSSSLIKLCHRPHMSSLVYIFDLDERYALRRAALKIGMLDIYAGVNNIPEAGVELSHTRGELSCAREELSGAGVKCL